MTEILDLESLAARVDDGMSVAVAPDYSGCPMALVRVLIARGASRLRLIGVPQCGFQGDMLIGAGCVASVETAAVTLGEYGLAPRFTEAVKSGGIEILDATCPAIHAGLQAAEKGLPFMPIRGLIGSDLMRHRSDWKIIENPFGPGEPIVAVAAIRPDVALIHAPLADRQGNVWVGVRRELMLMAHAARHTLVTVERFVDDDLAASRELASGTIPGLYITAVSQVALGARPLGLFGTYEADREELARYASMARTRAGFERYLAGECEVSPAA